MRRSRSTCAELAAAAVLVAATLSSGVARAQACCSGVALVTPGRLRSYEDLAIGAQARAGTVVGTSGSSGAYAATPAGTWERDLEQDLFVVGRVARPLQVGLLVPLVETARATRDARELGGGLGDLAASARWDFTLAGESSGLPGFALIAGATAPTGTPVDRATRPLATDATGEGVWQLSAAAQLEHVVARWFASALAGVTWHAARTAAGLASQRAPRLAAQVVFGRAFGMGASLAATATLDAEGTTSVAGENAPDSAQRRVRVGLAGGVAPSLAWRVQASLLAPVPASGVGENDVASVTLAVAVTRTF